MIVQKYLVQKSICSRREAENLLRNKLIYVNGKPAIPGVPLLPTDIVTIDEQAAQELKKKITVAIYKPRGIMCSRSENEGTNVFDIFPQWQALNAVGRLDKESEGLLLLSNDGLVTKAVTGDTHATEKEYEVTTVEEVFAGKLKRMESPMMLSDELTLPAKVTVINKHTFRIILHEGKNRQIRRMCGQLNLTITSLKRIRIRNIHLGLLQPGEGRELTSPEVQTLKEAKGI